MWRKALVLGLVVCVVASGVTVAQVGSTTYMQGYRDGREAGQNDTPIFNVVWGWLFGIFDLAVVAFSGADVPAERLMFLEGKSEDYKLGYVEGYKKGRTSRRFTYSAVGWALWVGTVILLSGY